jgi:[ribosomal protein S5]-alanine N-acetyltransferase
MKPPSEIETDRLRLRPPRMEDAPAIFHGYAQDPEVSRFLVWSPHRSIVETEEFLARCVAKWADETAFPWALIKKSDGALIGMIELRVEGHKANVGYVLRQSAWGEGYATEAARWIVDWAINQDSIYRVWAVCDVENHPSARVLEKAGMQREGVLRRWMVHPNFGDEPRASYCYSRVK